MKENPFKGMHKHTKWNVQRTNGTSIFANGSTWRACERKASAATHVFSHRHVFTVCKRTLQHTAMSLMVSQCIVFRISSYPDFCIFWVCLLSALLLGECKSRVALLLLFAQVPRSSLTTGSPTSDWKTRKEKSLSSWSTVHPYGLFTPKWYWCALDRCCFYCVAKYVQWINGQESIGIKHWSISVHLPILSPQVPAAVAHSEFWQRYFYKVYQLDQVILLYKIDWIAPQQVLSWLIWGLWCHLLARGGANKQGLLSTSWVSITLSSVQ